MLAYHVLKCLHISTTNYDIILYFTLIHCQLHLNLSDASDYKYIDKSMLKVEQICTYCRRYVPPVRLVSLNPVLWTTCIKTDCLDELHFVRSYFKLYDELQLYISIYSLFTVMKHCPPLGIIEVQGFLRVNRPYL